MTALEEGPAPVAEGHTQLVKCMLLSGAQHGSVAWGGPSSSSSSHPSSPCILNIRPVARHTQDLVVQHGEPSQRWWRRLGEATSTLLPLPQLPSSQPLGFVEHDRAANYHPFLKKSLLSPQGMSKVGFCFWEERGPTGEDLLNSVVRKAFWALESHS